MPASFVACSVLFTVSAPKIQANHGPSLSSFEVTPHDQEQEDHVEEQLWINRGQYSLATVYDSSSAAHDTSKLFNRTVCCFYDGSNGSLEALSEAVRSKKPNDLLVVVHVVELMGALNLEKYTEIGHWDEAELDHVNRLGKKEGVILTKVLATTALIKDVPNVRIEVLSSLVPRACAVARANDLKAKVVYCGTRGHGKLSELLLGSFSRHLFYHTQCTMVISRGGSSLRI